MSIQASEDITRVMIGLPKRHNKQDIYVPKGTRGEIVRSEYLADRTRLNTLVRFEKHGLVWISGHWIK